MNKCIEKFSSFLNVLSLERFFVLTAVIFGFLYIIFIPPFQNVDENTHYFRVINIATNSGALEKMDNLVGANLPEKYVKYARNYDYLIKNINAKVNGGGGANSTSEQLVWANFSNTALYNPLSYLQCLPVAFFIGSFDLSPVVALYLMRLCSLAGFVAFGFVILRTLPVAKLAATVLLLLPMSLSLGASVTTDVMVIGCNFLWCAFVLRLLKKDKVKNLDIFFLIFLAAITALCKNYFLNLFMIFLLPQSKFSSKIKYFLTLAGVMFLGFLPSVCWANYIKDFIVPLNAEANPFLQLTFIGKHFFEYLIILLKSLFIKLPRVIITMVGVLGWQDTRLDFITYAIYPIIFYIAVKCKNIDNVFVLEKWQKILLWTIFVFGTMVVSTYMYLSWSPVGAQIITGLNGKYYLPLMMILTFCMFTNKSFFEGELFEKNIRFWIYIAIWSCLISSVLSIIHRFYGLTPNLYYSV